MSLEYSAFDHKSEQSKQDELDNAEALTNIEQ